MPCAERIVPDDGGGRIWDAYALEGGLGSVDPVVLVVEGVEAVARHALKGSRKVGGKCVNANLFAEDLCREY